MNCLEYQKFENLLLLNRFGNPRKVREWFESGIRLEEAIERLKYEKEKSNVSDEQGFTLPRAVHESWAERELESCQKKGIELCALWDANYPSLLKEIADPPLLLYVKGSLEPSDEAALAIVGTRHPSFYGSDQTKKFARSLAEKGLTIVSGFARGVDQMAHGGALEVSYGRTIAVLGCGLDVSYPKGSEKLFSAVADRGAVISEFCLGTSPRAENFPRRNRIISGLSLGVLVVEAHSISGSLITAHEAAEQGREVFALPGPVNQLTSRGTHHLIQEGAALVEGAEDVLEILAPRLIGAFSSPSKEKVGSEEAILPPKEIESLSKEAATLVHLLEEGPLLMDQILKKVSFHPSLTVSMLTQLELTRKIQRLPSGHFKLSKS